MFAIATGVITLVAGLSSLLRISYQTWTLLTNSLDIAWLASHAAYPLQPLRHRLHHPSLPRPNHLVPNSPRKRKPPLSLPRNKHKHHRRLRRTIPMLRILQLYLSFLCRECYCVSGCEHRSH